jgi:hypothetical protein
MGKPIRAISASISEAYDPRVNEVITAKTVVDSKGRVWLQLTQDGTAGPWALVDLPETHGKKPPQRKAQKAIRR